MKPKRRLKMRPEEIHDMSDEEIDARIKDLGVALFRERGRKKNLRMGYTKDGANLYAAVRKNLARLKTVKRERELGIRTTGGA